MLQNYMVVFYQLKCIQYANKKSLEMDILQKESQIDLTFN